MHSSRYQALRAQGEEWEERGVFESKQRRLAGEEQIDPRGVKESSYGVCKKVGWN